MEADFMFRRKIYDKLLEWKTESDGRTALLIEGARRVGKSTVVEEFAKNEYESYILIDFSFLTWDKYILHVTFDRNQRTGLHVIISVICHQCFDCLSRKGTLLYFVKYNQ